MADATGSAASTMRAGDVGRAARNDLQFRIPRKPAVRRGVRMRLDDGAWVLDGGRKNQTLGGRFAREHLGALLQACDGTRTLAEIGEATGIGPQGAFEAVCLLWTGGILEEGGTEPLPDPQPAPELACLLSRLGDSTGVNDSWQDAARRLAAARVAVLGDAGLVEEIIGALDPTLSARAAAGAEPDDALAVVVETTASAPAAGVAERCWTLGIPLLRVRIEHDAVTVGPYIDPSFSPCLECATADESGPGATPDADRRDLAVGLAARTVAALIARATVTHLPGDVRRIDLETFTRSDRPVATRPGCPVCSAASASRRADGSPAPIAPSAPVGARYEQAVAIPPTAFMDSKGHQQHYKPSNLRLQHAFRDWPVCPRAPLPAADLALLQRPWPSGAGEEGPRADGVSTTELATILALAAGVREPLSRGANAEGGSDGTASTDLGAKLRRWTAAGGNIGSVTAYVLVPEQPSAALAPGTYVYVERDHELALVGPPAPAGSATRVVLTGNIDKVSQKYYSFALRLAVQDCGCAFEVIRLVARALGLPIRARSRWDEKGIAALIGTDPAREPVCAVVELPDGAGGARGAEGAVGTGGSDAL